MNIVRGTAQQLTALILDNNPPALLKTRIQQIATIYLKRESRNIILTKNNATAKNRQDAALLIITRIHEYAHTSRPSVTSLKDFPIAEPDFGIRASIHHSDTDTVIPRLERKQNRV